MGFEDTNQSSSRINESSNPPRPSNQVCSQVRGSNLKINPLIEFKMWSRQPQVVSFLPTPHFLLLRKKGERSGEKRFSTHFAQTGSTLPISRCCLGFFVVVVFNNLRDLSTFQRGGWILYGFKIHGPQTTNYIYLTYEEFHWFLKSESEGAAICLTASLQCLKSQAQCLYLLNEQMDEWTISEGGKQLLHTTPHMYHQLLLTHTTCPLLSPSRSISIYNDQEVCFLSF